MGGFWYGAALPTVTVNLVLVEETKAGNIGYSQSVVLDDDLPLTVAGTIFSSPGPTRPDSVGWCEGAAGY